MKTLVKIVKEVDIKYVNINSYVRYWEDSLINGVEDISNPTIDNPPNIPKSIWDVGNQEFRWAPIIDIDNGVILDWPKDIVASVHYKVCDEFKCSFSSSLSEDDVIYNYEGYVPNFMCPDDCGYGDYIIMSIDEFGKIINWNKYYVKDFLERKYNGEI